MTPGYDELVRMQRIRLAQACPHCRNYAWSGRMQPKQDVLGKFHHPSCTAAHYPR